MIERRPTQVDVAREAGVSRQTVSLVTRDDPRVSAHSRELVLAAMKKLGYRPNVAARALAARCTGFVGISLSDLVNPFHGELIELIRGHCEAQGLVPFIAPVGQDAADEKVAIERLLEMNVDGLILISPMADDESLDRIGSQVPTVVVTRNAGPDSVDLVHTDDRAGARAVVGELMASGYRPVVYLGVDRPVSGDSSRARIEGYRSILAEAGYEPRVEMVSPGEVGRALGRVVQEFGNGFGLCCHNDLIALEAIGHLEVFGLRPGRDVGVTGFDNSGISGYPGIQLTTVDQSTAAMARRAVDLLSERMGGRAEPVDVVMPARLVTRATSGRTGYLR